MLACVDVDYRVNDAVAACLVFADPGDAAPLSEHVARLPISAPYQPGQLYLRELPPILAVLSQVKVSLIIVDGHVWLGPQHKGLGAHLHDAVHLPVIGVAKHAYRGAPAIPIRRGQSQTPLYVTAIDFDPQTAARLITRMHGPHRLPTLLKRVDRLSRTA
jgi:deoxyribonuclease V